MKTLNLKEQAVLLTKLGLRVHPVKGKAALVDDWLVEATVDQGRVDVWLKKFQGVMTGWGCACSDDDPYWILDADNCDWLIEELSARKIAPPDGLMVMSGGGSGCHIYVKGRRPYWAKSVANPRFDKTKPKEQQTEKANLIEFPRNVVAPYSIHPKTGNPYLPTKRWQEREWKLAEMGEAQEAFVSFLRELCFIRKPESAPELKPVGLRRGLALEKVLDGTALQGKYKKRDGGDRIWLDYHKDFGACCVKGEAHHDADNNRKCGFYYMKADSSDWGHFCFSPACQCVEGGQRTAAMKFLGMDLADILVPRWRRDFRSPLQLSQAPLSFVVNNFIPEDGITGVGGVPGHSKSWILLSIAKALRNGPCKLWDRLVVPKEFEVLYLTPEVGDRAVMDRVRRLRMLRFGDAEELIDDEGFLIRTMSMGKKLALDAPSLLRAAEGKVVFLDTLVRFLDGRDENSSTDIAQLFELMNALLAASAVAIVVAHHSRKPGESFPFVMTQESVFRGSGDIAANLAAGHGVYQLDRKTRDQTLIHVECVKPKDFEPLPPFQIKGRPHIDEEGDFRMHKWQCRLFDEELKAYDKGSDPESPRVDSRWIEAKKMRDEGKLLEEVAKHFNVSERQIQRWLERLAEAEGKQQSQEEQENIGFKEDM
jgi:hypothetical protein